MEAPMTPPPTINTSGCVMLCSLRPRGYRRSPATEVGNGFATSGQCQVSHYAFSVRHVMTC